MPWCIFYITMFKSTSLQYNYNILYIGERKKQITSMKHDLPLKAKNKNACNQHYYLEPRNLFNDRRFSIFLSLQ